MAPNFPFCSAYLVLLPRRLLLARLRGLRHLRRADHLALRLQHPNDVVDGCVELVGRGFLFRRAVVQGLGCERAVRAG